MQIKKILQEKLTNAFIKCDYPTEDVQLSFSNKPEISDYQCNSAFVLAKRLRLTPTLIANRIIENIDNSEGYFEINFVAPAFINFRLTLKALNIIANDCLSDDRLTLLMRIIQSNPKPRILDKFKQTRLRIRVSYPRSCLAEVAKNVEFGWVLVSAVR